MNRLITRGMGTSTGAAGRAGMITQGMGGFFGAVIEAAAEAGRRIVHGGRSAAKKIAEQFDRIVVAMKLIRINGEPADPRPSGAEYVKTNVDRPLRVKVEKRFNVRVREAWEDVKISIKRVK